MTTNENNINRITQDSNGKLTTELRRRWKDAGKKL